MRRVEAALPMEFYAEERCAPRLKPAFMWGMWTARLSPRSVRTSDEADLDRAEHCLLYSLHMVLATRLYRRMRRKASKSLQDS